VGNTALAEDYQDTFSALLSMMSIWNRKRWLVFHDIELVKVSTGAQSYSVGPGGDFNTPRPDRLEAAFFRQFPQASGQAVDYPLQILQSREDYNQVVLKTLVSWPAFIFYDSAFPLGFVYPWPIPQGSTYELHLTVKDTLPTFSSYVQTVNLPPEYFEALWSNLTIRLGAIYPGANITDDTRGIAKASLEAIRGANAQIARLRMPMRFSRPPLYNIFSGQTY
jgi:hypothetical protein